MFIKRRLLYSAKIILCMAGWMISPPIYADNLIMEGRNTQTVDEKKHTAYDGLPKNTRQTQEGYWVGSNPSLSEIRALHARNVKLIVTLTPVFDPDGSLKANLEALGMTHINIPFGGQFPRPTRFYQRMLAFEPHETYIHCEHGGDRTGAFLAYMLVMRHDWSVQRAFLSVLHPLDVSRLRNVLKRRGYATDQADIDAYLGIYSPEKNGGYGGLKVRSMDYIRLIHTTIDAMEQTKRIRIREAKLASSR